MRRLNSAIEKALMQTPPLLNTLDPEPTLFLRSRLTGHWLPRVRLPLRLGLNEGWVAVVSLPIKVKYFSPFRSLTVCSPLRR